MSEQMIIALSLIFFVGLALYIKSKKDSPSHPGWLRIVLKYKIIMIVLCFMGPFAVAFGLLVATPTPPLTIIKEEFRSVPNYSVVLDAQKVDGSDFYQKYTVIIPDLENKKLEKIQRPWGETYKGDYNSSQPLVGMTVWTKEDGLGSPAANSPGSEYVNNPNYGKWEQRDGMSPVWVWFAGYALYNSYNPSRRWSYDDYLTERSFQRDSGRRSGYSKTEYVDDSSTSRGSSSKGKPTLSTKASSKGKPAFSTRVQTTKKTQKSTFSSRVQRKIGRSSVAVRSRGRSGGK
ncbi:hypothetical protein [Halodesulfovibrio sp. MK-HDV]|jgi:hypothetical protein|uniref:hypothetical protein n=1 Tax=Halodesulfovibrio sp. MK-HDV TaxID=2599925 RepID=UPI00136BF980|nr:hypothetical protein [Halodesulfovibrio sp. MK-HDV]KAF1074105.1 hypothetical protein MKHDV_03092 [Halodesulfovibrio sp. MK-HDV]